MPPGPLFVLGPQRPVPNIADALAHVPGSGPIVTITAGWRHDEGELDALHGAIGEGAVSLPLYAWYDELVRTEPALVAAYKTRQSEIKALKRLHRMRLHPSLEAVRRLLDEAEHQRELVRPQLIWALKDLRDIDDQLIRQCRSIREQHASVRRPWTHPGVAPRHAEAVRMIREARAVVIAGGHVAVLRNRLRFFGLHDAIRSARAVIAWSAGAMVLTERVVLFYDDPPEGANHAEVLDDGFGLIKEVVLLPHARRRLRLHDASRVSLLATRFTPAACIAMENGAWLGREGGKWVNRGTPETAMILGTNGAVVPLEPA